MDTTLKEVSDAVKAIPDVYTRLAELGREVESEVAYLKNELEIIKERLEQVDVPETEPEPGHTDEVLLSCTNDGSAIVNNELIQAMRAAAERNVPVRIPKGLYWIKPGLQITASLIGVEATLFTKESGLYNVMVQTVGSRLRISRITFDQRHDAAMLPDSKNYKGLHIIHIPDGNDITVDGCTFYGCGVTSILSNPFDGFGYNLSIENNTFYWQRKVNSYYDVSIINADGVDIYVANNEINVSKHSAVDDWWAETGIEFHCCAGSLKNNKISNCVNGVIQLPYPSLYKNYNPALQGETVIYNNDIQKVCRGIVSWGRVPTSNLPIVTRDTRVYNNTILLYLDRRGRSYYYPSVGIGLVDGGLDNSIFEKMSMFENTILTSYAEGLNSRAILNYGPLSSTLGGIYLMTNNSCKTIDIKNNYVKFPFTAIQCRATGKNIHENINIVGNTFEGCAIYRGYLSDGFDALYNFENINKGSVFGNAIIGTPIKIRHDGKNVANIDYIQN